MRRSGSVSSFAVAFLGLVIGFASGGCSSSPDVRGAGGAGGSAGPGGATGAATGGTTGKTYVPDVPAAYDGAYLDGSFEQNQGFGWDTCHTRTPEHLQVVMNGGSQGTDYLLFQTAACEIPDCSPSSPSASEVSVWFKTAPDLTAPVGLYFDAKNEGTDAPDGLLRLYGTDGTCEQESLFAEIPLADLELSQSWATRCVDLTGLASHDAIGLAVTGGSHQIGLDALRLGPACHRSVANPDVRFAFRHLTVP